MADDPQTRARKLAAKAKAYSLVDAAIENGVFMIAIWKVDPAIKYIDLKVMAAEYPQDAIMPSVQVLGGWLQKNAVGKPHGLILPEGPLPDLRSPGGMA